MSLVTERVVCPDCGSTLRRHCRTPLLGKMTDMGEVGSSRTCSWLVCTRCAGFGDRNIVGSWVPGHR